MEAFGRTCSCDFQGADRFCLGRRNWYLNGFRKPASLTRSRHRLTAVLSTNLSISGPSACNQLPKAPQKRFPRDRFDQPIPELS
jgi:hypothetical protein